MPAAEAMGDCTRKKICLVRTGALELVLSDDVIARLDDVSAGMRAVLDGAEDDVEDEA